MINKIFRRDPPTPWDGGDKIPLDDPVFSARMLREHLDQQHDRASRRFEVIDRHVAWIDEVVLEGRPGQVLDLGCGPGFYTSRLARKGHECVGIDFAPAAIEYAKKEAELQSLGCLYLLQDVCKGGFGEGFDLALMLYGEFNVLAPKELQAVLHHTRQALRPGGTIIIEVHSETYVRALAAAGSSWFAAEESLFADEPHVCLRESFWNDTERTAMDQYFIISEDGAVSSYVGTTQAYSDREYSQLLMASGFERLEQHPTLGSPVTDDGLFVLLGHAGSQTT